MHDRTAQKRPVVFITGGSSGIGLGLVRRFVRAGCRVTSAARRSCGEADLSLICDVTDKSSVRDAVEACEEKLGPIDIVIANAGIGHPSPGYALDSEIFERTFRTNVFGMLYVFEAVIPKMVERRQGQLVAISSLAAYRGLPEAGSYCASKAAVSSLTESLRLDLKRFGIAVTLVHPGYIKTPMTDRNRYVMPFLMETEKGVEKIYRAIVDQKSVVAFPWPLSMIVKSFRWWPVWLYDRVMAGRKNIKVEAPSSIP